MSKKKGKFDLTRLVHEDYLRDNEMIFFVSNPSLSAKIQRQPNGEYKVLTTDGVSTVHAFVQKCLGTEPPEHASRWLRNEKNVTLYQLWQASEDENAVA